MDRGPADSRWWDRSGVSGSHEIGHALGLAHSDDPNALMYPFYSGARNLDQDDIDGIRSIYPWGWKAVYAQGDPGGGIGGYDCKSGGDKVFAFNYKWWRFAVSNRHRQDGRTTLIRCQETGGARIRPA